MAAREEAEQPYCELGKYAIVVNGGAESQLVTHPVCILRRTAGIQGGLQRLHVASLGSCLDCPFRRRGVIVAPLQSRG